MNKIAAAILLALAAASAQAQGMIELLLSPGPAYTHTKWFGPVPATLRPQMAFWIETADGRYVATVYVTHRSAAADWRAAGGARRPEALPVWSHARGVKAANGMYMPEPAHPLPDAISGATPKGAFATTWELPKGLAAGVYRIRAELNESFDWNEAFPDKLPRSDPRWSEANGQPSVVWEGSITIGPLPDQVKLTPVGTGALDGSDGDLRPGVEGLTSALTIAASIAATYRP